MTVSVFAIIAFLFVSLITYLVARLVVLLRARTYKIETDEATQATRLHESADTYGLVDLLDRVWQPQEFIENEKYVAAENDRAAHLQSRYHFAVASSAAALALALLALALNLTLLKQQQPLKLLAASIDVIAVIYASVAFVYARCINRRWVLQRTLAELLRVWCHLAIVFDLVDEEESGSGGLPIERVAERVRTNVLGRERWWYRFLLRQSTEQSEDKRYALLHRRIDQYWADLQANCSSIGIRQSQAEQSVALYLRERPLYQLCFFQTAQRRLEDSKTKREIFMLLLFLSSALAGLLKAAIAFKIDLPASAIPYIELLPPTTSDVLSLILLATLIVSSAITSVHLSRTDRSLAHRYFTQERRIRTWLTNFKQFRATGVNVLDVTSYPALINQLLAFENTMIDELIDWIHITSRDTIQLGG